MDGAYYHVDFLKRFAEIAESALSLQHVTSLNVVSFCPSLGQPPSPCCGPLLRIHSPRLEVLAGVYREQQVPWKVPLACAQR